MGMPDKVFPADVWGTMLARREAETMILRRLAAWPLLRLHQFEREGGVIVLHPETLHAILMEQMMAPPGEQVTWRAEPGPEGRGEIRYRQWLVVQDPALRLDEIGLRREEVLTRERTD
jgi:hypothetical protein